MSGLSPLARGTRRLFNFKRLKPRFIPAGAGNTLVEIDAKYEKPVYPRWRGEHMKRRTNPHGVGGLSPLARGTHPHFRRYESVFRFIPAGAGNTGSRSLTKLSATVYPRWRGEHSHLPCSRWSRSGLSPLARGTLILFSSHRYRRRFIPAGAGNTGLLSDGI